MTVTTYIIDQRNLIDTFTLMFSEDKDFSSTVENFSLELNKLPKGAVDWENLKQCVTHGERLADTFGDDFAIEWLSKQLESIGFLTLPS